MNKLQKSPAYLALFVTGLLITAPLSLAQTQTSTQPPPPPPAGTVVFTREPLPQPPPEPVITQETRETSGTSSGTTATTTATSTPPRTTSLPQPELPVIDLETTQETQAQCPTATALSPEQCLDPRDAQATIIPPVLGNQAKISVLVLLAALLGTVFWIVSNFIMNTAQTRRDAIRFARQDRFATEERRIETLRESYNELIDSLAGLLKPTGNKMIMDQQALAAYKKASVGVEMFGSEEALNANGKLLKLASAGHAPSPAEFESAKTDLLNAMKKDLGI